MWAIQASVRAITPIEVIRRQEEQLVICSQISLGAALAPAMVIKNLDMWIGCLAALQPASLAVVWLHRRNRLCLKCLLDGTVSF